MIIDGSIGEGGGQVVRTALGLAAVFSKNLEISHIRAGRPSPGLRPQHLAAARMMAGIAGARLCGDEIMSQSLSFFPDGLRGVTDDIDIGTAGSLTLLMHAALLPLSLAKEESHLGLVGGTDVSWSPTIDYFRHVTLPALRLAGVNASCRLVRRGYYPKGGGSAVLDVVPSRGISGLSFGRLKEPDTVHVISTCAGLSESVAQRQAESACAHLSDYGLSVEADCSGSGVGSSLTIWAQAGPVPIGACAVGKRGYSAYDVGKDAAESFRKTLRTQCLDPNLSDQLAPFLCLAKESSTIPVSEVTGHLSTVLDIASAFVPISWSHEKGMLKIERK